jgi:ABC-type multidrug transport system ATPase subunit
MELVFEHVCKNYGDKEALKDFTATFTPGVYGILGPNGAGKSTLMALITDNIKRTSGKILYDGTDIVALGSKFRGLVGFMPQEQGMYDNFSGKQFLFYMAALKSIKKKDAKVQIAELVTLVGLENEIHRKINGYSGGMRQRLMLAQALLGNPAVLILDEPTAGLDPEERIRIRNYIGKLAQDKIVLLATHVVSDIEQTANQVVMIKRGRLVGIDTPEQLIASVHGENLEDVYMHYLEDDKGRNE